MVISTKEILRREGSEGGFGRRLAREKGAPASYSSNITNEMKTLSVQRKHTSKEFWRSLRLNSSISCLKKGSTITGSSGDITEAQRRRKPNLIDLSERGGVWKKNRASLLINPGGEQSSRADKPTRTGRVEGSMDLPL